MQESSASIPHWAQLILTSVASIVSAIGIDRLYNNWLNRKKPAAEINVTDATAEEITVRAQASASDSMMRMMDRLSSAQEVIDRVRSERDEWRVRALNAESEVKTSELFVKQLHAAATLKGVQLSEFMPEQLNPKEDPVNKP